MTQIVATFEKIKQVLPHRYPFLLVDRVLQVDEQSIRALKNVTGNEAFFNGHFSNFAVMPGVLQIEAMAQAAGLILALSSGFDVKKQAAFLASVEQAKFKKQVTPGDQLILEAKVLVRKKNLVKVQASASVDNQLASSANIILIMQDCGDEK